MCKAFSCLCPEKGKVVWKTVGNSVGNSVWAQIGSVFRLEIKEWRGTDKIPGRIYPFQSAVDLWDEGLVPSFDGKVWRLHGGPEAKVLFEVPVASLWAGPEK